MRWLVIGLTLAGIALLCAVPPGRLEMSVSMAGPFPHHRGFAYLAEIPHRWTSTDEWRLFENEHELGPRTF